DQHFPEWNERTANLVWELRPPKVLARLEAKLTDNSLPPGQRTRIVDILAASPQEPAGASLIKALGDELAPAPSGRSAQHLRISWPGSWRGLRQSSELTQAVRRLLARSEERSVALALVGAAERADFCGQVAAIVRDIREPDAIRVTAIRTLGLLPCESAIL